MAGKDYYNILGLSKSASADEIKKSYRKLAMKYHPDRNNGDKKAEAQFKEVSEAYAVLSDPEKRKQYDMFGSEGFQSRFSQEDIFRDFDFGSIFKEFGFGGGGQGQNIFSHIFGGAGQGSFKGGRCSFDPRFGNFTGSAQPIKGKDLIYEMSLSLEDVFINSEKVISYKNSKGQNSQVSVKIPAGISTGKKLRLKGKGQAGINGGPNGDLFIRINVLKHPVFERAGDDLLFIKDIKFSEAAMGTEVEVATIDKKFLRLKIPPGTQNNGRLRLKGYGMPHMDGKGRGDAYAIMNIEIPKKLNKRQKTLLQELAQTGL
ncbi:MAG: DnaJ domain-containing protein [Deltaproteobacteria bacterium]|nr:DnaJ domain-containing protein [Deltaproteobacteria bacterium]